MLIHITYEQAKVNLEELCQQVIHNRDTLIIERDGGEDVALIAVDELSSMGETIYLLSSIANASRLHTALKQAQSRAVKPQTVDDLFKELGING
jgi:antitoxin YefM